MEPDRSRRIQIGLATLLMGAAAYMLGNNLLADRHTAKLLPARDVEVPVLLKEAGMFAEATRVAEGDDSGSARTLAEYYSRRAYPGAPPVIPHRLLDAKGIGAQGCNGCHGHGGWVPQFNAYTPVTPHPRWSNCLSCHVPAGEKTRFRESTFTPASTPPRYAAALPGGPPPVPHSLDYRAACPACHAGPGAVKELRTNHPQRQNCRQCHVSHESDQVFSRP